MTAVAQVLAPRLPWRHVAVGLLGAVVVALAVATIGDGSGYIPDARVLGFDYVTYRDAAMRFLAGDGFYLQRQLAGPFDFVTFREVMYPPSSLALFVPMAFAPAVLWWLIPAGIIAWSVRVHRPNPLALALMLVALCSRMSVTDWVVGNPGIWLAAAVAAATMWGTGPLVLFKPSYFPLALIGFMRRGWWLAACVVFWAIVLALPLWLDYLTVIRNAPPVWYSLAGDVPLVAVPLFAWLGRDPGSTRFSLVRVCRGDSPRS